MSQSVIKYSSSDIESLTAQLIEKIKSAGRTYNCVVGIKNGGIHISQPIAEAFNLPHIGVRISFYDGQKKRRTPISKKGKFKLGDYSSCLIVDDLIDSGDTLIEFENLYGLRYEDDVAVLFWKNGGSFVPDFYVEPKPKGWIEFPWE